MVGGLSRKRTRMATLSSCARSATPPSRIVSDRPVLAPASAGTLHSGPKRGKNTYSASITGTPITRHREAAPRAASKVGRPTVRCASTSELSSPSTAATISTAMKMACENRNCVRIRKKPREVMTKASRRARSSKVLSAARMVTSVTPACRPNSDW